MDVIDDRGIARPFTPEAAAWLRAWIESAPPLYSIEREDDDDEHAWRWRVRTPKRTPKKRKVATA